jgi:hypothetical protein
MHPHSRGTKCPSWSSNGAPLKTEGAGKAGCWLHPRSHAQQQEKRARAYRSNRYSPGFSLHNGFNGLPRALPGGRLCHRRRAELLCRVDPVRSALPPRNLTPALGRRDHTASPSAASIVVCAPASLTTSFCEEIALRSHWRADTAASTAFRPAFRDDRDTPLYRDGTTWHIALNLICVKCK